METAELVSIIIAVGALLPLLTSVVQQGTWSTTTRTIVGVSISAIAGLVTYVTQFGLDFSNVTALVTTVVGVILAAGTAYKTVWQPSGVASKLEGKTSPTPVVPDPEAAPVVVEEAPLVDDEDWVVVIAESTPEDQPTELEMPAYFDDGSSRT